MSVRPGAVAGPAMTCRRAGALAAFVLAPKIIAKKAPPAAAEQAAAECEKGM